MAKYDVAVVAGDGIGPEVTGEARKVVDACGDRFGFSVCWQDFPFGAEYYLANGVALPGSAFSELAQYDAMLLGAIGDPRVPPGPLEQEILLALRFHFDQYVNLRPALSYPGVSLPVAIPGGGKIDAVVVRENTEDLYMGIGGAGSGRISAPVSVSRGLYNFSGSIDMEFPGSVDAAFSLGVMTRRGVERIARFAFDLAARRGEKKVTVVSKANAVPHLYGFWDRVTREVAAEYKAIEYVGVNVDAICYLLVREPAGWGVVLCPNLFGDIVSDLFSGLAGGLGLAAAGNIGEGLSMFESVHGSAPALRGTGEANPLAAILSAGMLLDYLGEVDAAEALDGAVRGYLVGGESLPVEQGGCATTVEVGDRVRDRVLSG